jgi:hypothetical protein
MVTQILSKYVWLPRKTCQKSLDLVFSYEQNKKQISNNVFNFFFKVLKFLGMATLVGAWWWSGGVLVGHFSYFLYLKCVLSYFILPTPSSQKLEIPVWTQHTSWKSLCEHNTPPNFSHCPTRTTTSSSSPLLIPPAPTTPKQPPSLTTHPSAGTRLHWCLVFKNSVFILIIHKLSVDVNNSIS